jgi:hypothetical protein
MADDTGWEKNFLSDLQTKYNVPWTQNDSPTDEARLREYQAGIDRFHALQADPNTDWETESAKGAISTPEQLADFQHRLEVQYQQRGSNTDGQDDGFSHDPATRAQQMAAAGQGGGSQNTTPAQAWNNTNTTTTNTQQGGLFPDWYKDLMTRSLDQQQQAQADSKARADAYYQTLTQRAGQGLAVDANDPIIKAQTDAYNAQGDRALRNYLSDQAEQLGPYGNIQGERRMGAEALGQNTAGFQAQLLGKELTARRDEIAQALSLQGAALSGDQQRALQAQLAQMDQAIREAGVGLQSQQIQQTGQLGFADLDLRSQLGNRGFDIQSQLGNRGYDIQSQLGNRNIDLGYYTAGNQNDQFLRELALRQWQLGDQSNWNWAQL